MGNVLLKYDTSFYLKDYSEKDKEILYRTIYGSVDWIRLDRGVFGEDELIRRVTQKLPEHLKAEAEKLIRWYAPPIPVEGMGELITKLKSDGYKIYLLSNTSDAFYKFYKGIPAIDLFDGLFTSAENKCLKPEAEIYQKFLNKFSLNANECIFVDDSPVNIEASIRAGMNGIIFYGDAKELEKYISDTVKEKK